MAQSVIAGIGKIAVISRFQSLTLGIIRRSEYLIAWIEQKSIDYAGSPVLALLPSSRLPLAASGLRQSWSKHSARRRCPQWLRGDESSAWLPGLPV
jgi:hypothetical protein